MTRSRIVSGKRSSTSSVSTDAANKRYRGRRDGTIPPIEYKTIEQACEALEWSAPSQSVIGVATGYAARGGGSASTRMIVGMNARLGTENMPTDPLIVTCVCCGAHLPVLANREEYVRKGCAVLLPTGQQIYFCPGRHSLEEIQQKIRATPSFSTGSQYRKGIL